MSEPNIFTQEIKKNIQIDTNFNKKEGNVELIPEKLYSRRPPYIIKVKNNNDTLIVKIAQIKDGNNLEVKILNNTNKIITRNISPHFPFKYYSKGFIFDRDNKQLLSANFNDEQNILPIKTLEYDYLMYCYELFAGDLNIYLNEEIDTYVKEEIDTYVKKEIDTYVKKEFKTISNEEIDINRKKQQTKYISNALLQIFISILSYHNLGYIHNDCHAGNFLYKKVEKGGYIKYNIFGKTLYLENIGFIWAIWDYEYSINITSDSIIKISAEFIKYIKLNYNKFVYDYLFLITWLNNTYDANDIYINILKKLQEINKLDTKDDYEKLIFDYLKDFFDTPPEDSEIINEVAYIVPFEFKMTNMEMDGGGKKQKYTKTNIIKNINGKNKTIYLKENYGKTQYVKHNSQYIKLTEYRKK